MSAARDFRYHNTAFGVYPDSNIYTLPETDSRQLVISHAGGSGITLFLGEPGEDASLVYTIGRLIDALTVLRDATETRIAAAEPETVAS